MPLFTSKQNLKQGVKQYVIKFIMYIFKKIDKTQKLLQKTT